MKNPMLQRLLRKVIYLTECDPEQIGLGDQRLEDADEALGSDWDVDEDGRLIHTGIKLVKLEDVKGTQDTEHRVVTEFLMLSQAFEEAVQANCGKLVSLKTVQLIEEDWQDGKHCSYEYVFKISK